MRCFCPLWTSSLHLLHLLIVALFRLNSSMFIISLTRTDLRHHLFTVIHSDPFSKSNFLCQTYIYLIGSMSKWYSLTTGQKEENAHLCVGLCFSPHVDAIIWGQHSSLPPRLDHQSGRLESANSLLIINSQNSPLSQKKSLWSPREWLKINMKDKARENEQMGRDKRVAFERKRAEMFLGWLNHSETMPTSGFTLPQTQGHLG